jgi:chromosome segregation ATPase
MATTTKTPIGDQLAALEEEVKAAKHRRTEVDRERSNASGALRSAEERRLAMEERRAAGEEVDDEDLAAAVEAIEQAREAADGRVWKARADGADRAVDEAQEAVQEFGRDHFAELAAEEVPLDDPARVELQEAWSAFDDAASAYALRIRRWHRLAEFGGIDPRDIPINPLRGNDVEVRQRFAAGIVTPTPRPLKGGPAERG